MQKVFACYGNGFSKTRSRWKKDGTTKKDTFFTGAQSGGSVMSLELHDITIKIPVCFPLGESINVMSRDLEAYLAV